ncbi:hypothetical protein LNP17_15745 [Klebsiella variicola subsp. variicola]|nr:hypothetical protein [Klebsiella variicola subsp. variicola]
MVNGGQSVLTLATGEARDVVFDIAKPEAIPPQEQAGLRVSSSATRRCKRPPR